MTRPDLSFLSVVRDGPDDYVIGNGERFVNVPEIAADVVALLDGTRTVDEVRAEIHRARGVDVDVAGFVRGLDAAGLLRPPERPPNLWDRISPAVARPFFSPAANVLIGLVTCAALAAVIARPEILPSYDEIVWADSLAFTLSFAVGSWLLVFVHEFSHILAARSLGVRAELSLGTRLQFLVVQTRVTGIWQAPRRARYRVHLAGMRTDLLLVSACLCALYFTDNDVVRLVMLICLSQIVWQFLFFMRTDVYFAYANLTGNKNLMDDAQNYLRARLARRPAPGVPPSVRRYAWFVVLGRILGLGFFAGYTVPLTVVTCARALDEIAAAPGVPAGPVAILAIIALGWALYLYVFVTRRIRSRRRAAAPAAATG